MKQTKSFEFKEIARLKFFDIKSQKKTIQYKKLCNLELSSEQKVKQKYQSLRGFSLDQQCQNSGYYKSIRKSNFRKSLNKLAQPRTHIEIENGDSKEVDKILRKCKKLMSNGNKFKIQMNYFERHSRSCLGEIEKRMSNLISDGLGANYYL